MTESEIEYHLFHWPAVIRRQMADPDASPWMRSFVQSIARHGKRSTWTPSPKQAALMRQLVDEIGETDGEGFEVIEREERYGAA